MHPKFFIGARASKSTRFAVLDIDQNSQYHNKKSLDKILKALSDAGLSQSFLYRSSFSGGWHLYIFFEEPINSADLRKQLYKVLSLNDFRIAKGQLEIFPHPGGNGSQGLGLRLPLQPGFAWLSKETLEVEHERYELNATKALEFFLDVLDGGANSYEAFRRCKAHAQELEERKAGAVVLAHNASGDNVVPIRRSRKLDEPGEFIDFVRAVFHKLPPGIIVDNWYKGRMYHLDGLTAPSQRADAIECLGHYLFYGDPSRDLPALGYGCEKEREWAIREFLLTRHHDQSKDISAGKADALAQVERAANWRPAHKKTTESQKFRPSRPTAWIRENVNRKRDARKRISEALNGIKELKRSFTTVELQEAAGCSRETLYKHDDIWRQDYEDLAAGLFAICTDEYNGVVGAGSAETKPHTISLEPDVPPGLLAARRIAYEISMRHIRQVKADRKAAIRSQEASESDWLGNVTRVTEKDPSTLTIPELKALLVVLIGHLAMAPTEEAQRFVQDYISTIKNCLAEASAKTLNLVRPP